MLDRAVVCAMCELQLAHARLQCGAEPCGCAVPGRSLVNSIFAYEIKSSMDTLGIEPRAFRMLSGRDTTTPRALRYNYTGNT